MARYFRRRKFCRFTAEGVKIDRFWRLAIWSYRLTAE